MAAAARSVQRAAHPGRRRRSPAIGGYRAAGYFARRRKLGISRSSGSIWARWTGAGETLTIVRSTLATAAAASPPGSPDPGATALTVELLEEVARLGRGR